MTWILSDAVLHHVTPHLGTVELDGAKCQTVSLTGIQITADLLNTSPCEAMLAFLDQGIWPLRFVRNQVFLTAREQAKLLNSRAAIVGCGGLGGHLATLLARAGLGAITLCDFDVFDESNLNRQLGCREDRLGTNKAQALAEDLERIASHMRIRVYPVRANTARLPKILADAHIVLDCLDSLEDRFMLETAAHAAGIPFVHGAVSGEEGFSLVSRPDGPGLRNLYGKTYTATLQGAGSGQHVPTCTPAALAALQAHRALEELVGRGKKQADGLLHLDLSVPVLERFEI